jgi:hypothetical protein
MKIEYTNSKKDYPMLSEIPSGTVFSPIGSREIYIRLDKSGISDVFTDSYDTLEQETLSIQGLNNWDAYDDIIAVVHLSSGSLVFMNRKTRVIPLKCKLVVE